MEESWREWIREGEGTIGEGGKRMEEEGRGMEIMEEKGSVRDMEEEIGIQRKVFTECRRLLN